MEIGSWDLVWLSQSFYKYVDSDCCFFCVLQPQSKRRRVDERPSRGIGTSTCNSELPVTYLCVGGALWSGLTATLGGIISVVRGWFRRRPTTMSDSPQKSEEPLPSSPHSSTHSPPHSLCPPPHSPSSPPHSPSSPPTPSPPHSLSQMTHLPAHQPTSAHTVISQPLQPPITSHTIHHSTSRTTEMLWSKPVSGKPSILHQVEYSPAMQASATISLFQRQQAQHGMDPPTPPSASNSPLAPLSWTTGAHTSSDSLLIPSLDTAGPENIGPRYVLSVMYPQQVGVCVSSQIERATLISHICHSLYI